VSVLPSRKSEWVLTGQAFDGLLGLLDDDRGRAGEKYELARRRLTEFFEAGGSESPAEDADEALNRAARKIAGGEQVRDVNRYLFGVARLLLMELRRGRAASPVPLDAVAPPAAKSVEEAREEELWRAERERRFECFEACLGKLSPEERAFILDYYREEKGAKVDGRRRQAEVMGVSLNALRLRAARLRRLLGHCMGECLRRRAET
jgi:DNA-directed RNA polymerase specialized sigma24 family protein